jgi:hypothetical protein
MPLYLFLATLPCDILQHFSLFVIASSIRAMCLQLQFSIFLLSRIKSAQVPLMWVCVTFAYLIPTVVITMQILGPGAVDRQRKARGMLSRLAVAKVSVAEMEIL